MEEKNSVWGYILVAVVTIVIGVGIGLGISYFTKEDKEPNVVVDNNSNWEDGNQDNTNEQDDQNETNDWTDYVLNQEITEMYVAIWGEDENGEYYTKNVNITKTELSDIFSKTTKANLTKNHISGSGDSTPILVVKYVSNNKEYTLEMPYAREIWAEGLDLKLIELIELESYQEEGTYDNVNKYVVYVYDWEGADYLNKLIENR